MTQGFDAFYHFNTQPQRDETRRDKTRQLVSTLSSSSHLEFAAC